MACSKRYKKAAEAVIYDQTTIDTVRVSDADTGNCKGLLLHRGTYAGYRYRRGIVHRNNLYVEGTRRLIASAAIGELKIEVVGGIINSVVTIDYPSVDNILDGKSTADAEQGV